MASDSNSITALKLSKLSGYICWLFIYYLTAQVRFYQNLSLLLCGVILYINRKLVNGWLRYMDGDFLSPCFNVWIQRSIQPLLAGWYGGVSVCLIPFSFKNWANSRLANCGPLSDTTSWGVPKDANKLRRILMTLWEVVLAVGNTSNHGINGPVGGVLRYDRQILQLSTVSKCHCLYPDTIDNFEPNLSCEECLDVPHVSHLAGVVCI